MIHRKSLFHLLRIPSFFLGLLWLELIFSYCSIEVKKIETDIV